MSAAASLTLDDIRAAHARIRDKIHRTPVLTSSTLDGLADARLFFKCENLQKIGAFKARGAANAVFALSDEESRAGVATHSSGNHAAALARAAHLRGIPAHIVMPRNAPAAKIASVERFGGRIVFCEPTLAAREAAARRVIAETGAHLVHPYDDLQVMAGQGTAALELLEDHPGLDLIVCPVGGGGLLSGTGTAAKGMNPAIKVIGVEPMSADDAARSFRSGRLTSPADYDTIADGLRTSLSELSFVQIRRTVDDIVTVSEESIVAAMRAVWEVLKIVVEPSGAVPYAAIRDRSLDVRGKRVGLILTGGNLDLDRLPWMREEFNPRTSAPERCR